eukprot:4951506-Alexandrium_andersonii.AAC.1
MAMGNEHRTLRGREVVWMVIDYFKTHKSLQTYYSDQDLINFKWKGATNWRSSIVSGCTSSRTSARKWTPAC